MDPPRFVNYYSPLIRAMRICGLATPWIQKPSSLLPRLPFLIWDTFLVAIVVYMLFIYVYSVTTIYIPMQDLCVLGISCTSYTRGLMLTLFHFLYSDRLRAVTDDMDRIADSIQRSELGHSDIHQRLYLENANFSRLLVIVFFRFSSFFPFFYCLVVPISDYLSGKFRSKFPVMINSPFDDRQPGVYELIVFAMSTCVISTYAKKTANDCLFVPLFRIQADFLKYLSVTMNAMQKESLTSSGRVRRNLVLWVKLHQDVVKNIQDLIHVFSPVIVIYYLSVVVNIVFGAFILIKKDNESIFQSVMVSMYMVAALGYQLLISDTAQKLSMEANNLAEAAYGTPWYEMKKSDAEIISLVVQAANRPFQVTAYSVPMFLLSRETFAAFITTILSTFVTLCQIKENFDE